MRSLLIAFLIACGGSSPPPPQPVANTAPPPPPVDAAPPAPTGNAAILAKMTEFGDAMCKCTDQACAQQVADGMTRWGQEIAKANDPPPKFSDEETQQLTAVGQRMGECMQKAMGGGGSATP